MMTTDTDTLVPTHDCAYFRHYLTEHGYGEDTEKFTRMSCERSHVTYIPPGVTISTAPEEIKKFWEEMSEWAT